MVHLVWRGGKERIADRRGIVEICRVQAQPFPATAFVAEQMLETQRADRVGGTHQIMDLVPFFKEQLREVGAVLTSDAGDERLFRHSWSPGSLS